MVRVVGEELRPRGLASWRCAMEKTVMVVGNHAYVRREEAEGQMKVVCKEKN